MKIKSIMLLAAILVTVLSTSAFLPKNHVVTPLSFAGQPDFPEFLSHFEKVELPYGINIADLEKHQEYAQEVQQRATKKAKKQVRRQQLMLQFLPDLAASIRYSRMGAPEAIPLARFYPNEDMIAVIYQVRYPFRYSGTQTYSISVFDLNGNNLSDVAKLDERFLPAKAVTVASLDPTYTVTCRIDDEGNIWRNSYENIWEKELQDFGIMDNAIVDRKLSKTEVFRVDAAGQVSVLKGYPASSRAALE